MEEKCLKLKKKYVAKNKAKLPEISQGCHDGDFFGLYFEV